MHGKVIVTLDGLSLVETEEKDLDFIFEVENSPDNKNFIGSWIREQHMEAIRDEDMAHWIAWSETDKKPVGYVILSKIDRKNRVIEFRRIAIAEKGKGYGRLCVKLIKKAAFEYYGTHRLWLDVYDFNDRAAALYASEGFVKEGLLRDVYRKGDEYVSVFIMSILEGEYGKM